MKDIIIGIIYGIGQLFSGIYNAIKDRLSKATYAKRRKRVRIKFLPGDIVLIRKGTLWMLFSPAIQLFTWMFGPWSPYYHVEMVWEQKDDDGYTAFSMQPPLLDTVSRKFDEIEIAVYRLRHREPDLDEIFWRWGNPQIGKEIYGPHGACGWPVRDFYRDMFDLHMEPFPNTIDEYCRTSGEFVRIA